MPPHETRWVSIDTDESQQHGGTEILLRCLLIVQQLGPLSSLMIHCDSMTPAEVQLLSGLGLSKLYLSCCLDFSLDVLPPAERIEMRFWVRVWSDRRSMQNNVRKLLHANPALEVAVPEPLGDALPIVVSWQAAHTSADFHFHGPSRV